MTGLRPDPLHGAVRGARAGLLSGPAVGAAVVAHAAGGGCVSTLSVLASAGLAWSAAVALLGRSRSLLSVAGWLLGVQALTHVVLELACPTASVGNHAVGPLGAVHGVIGHGGGTAMLAAHLLAVALVAVLFAAGDSAVWSAHALRRAALRALRLVAGVRLPAVPHLAVRRVEATDEHPRVRWENAPLTRRGPPALLLAQQ